jgi:short-subunit dehydrogenase
VTSALVTGASGGIGLALARQLAANGFDLILAADSDRIHDAAAQFDHAEAVQVDLTDPAEVERLYARVKDRTPDVLVLNAGLTARSDDLERELALIDLNVRSTVHLARLITPDMAARGSGRVLITSSIVASMPGPHQATYNASKAFLQSFALGLRAELRERRVSVTVLQPGPTDTEIFARAGQQNTILGAAPGKDDPDDVARQGFEALMAGRERVVAASLAAKATELASRMLPDALTARLNALVTRPR